MTKFIRTFVPVFIISTLAGVFAFSARADQDASTEDAGPAADAGAPGKITIATGKDDSDDDDGEDQPVVHFHHKHHKGSHDDRVSMGSSVEVRPGETVGDAVSIGGSVTVGGHVTGDAVSIGGKVHVLPGGHVDGDGVAMGGAVDVDQGAILDGERVTLGGKGAELLDAKVSSFATVWHIVSSLVGMLGLIALGALFVAFIPERMERMKQALVARPVPAFGVGSLAFMGFIPANIVLAVTIVGLLLLPFLWLFFVLLVVLGLTLVAQLIGERMLRGAQFGGPFGALAVGAAIIGIVWMIPYLGFWMMVGAMIFGVGAALATRMGQAPPSAPAL